MKDILKALEDGSLELNAPWRSSDKSLAIVVPIVNKHPAERDYVLYSEVKDKVTLIDPGTIDESKVDNKSEKPVFFRGGSILKGSTQERTFQHGTIVLPGKVTEVPVRCVHAGRGIERGAHFQISEEAVPVSVQKNLLKKGSQSEVWHSADAHMGMMMAASPAMAADFRAARGTGDLTKAMGKFSEFSEELKKILKSIPDMANQVGIVIVDPEGVMGFEIYDHPQSWMAFSKTIVRSFAEILLKEDKIHAFEINMEVIPAVVNKFLESLKTAKEEGVLVSMQTQTVILNTSEHVGEYTKLNDKTIHAIIVRN